MANNFAIAKELPFQNLTDFSLANLFISSKVRLRSILKDAGIANVIARQLNPLQMESFNNITCDYYSEDDFNAINHNQACDVSVYHQNIRSLPKHAGMLFSYLQCLTIQFDVIILSEIGRKNIPMMKHVFKDYNFIFRIPDKNPRGGVGVFIRSSLDFRIREDLELKTTCGCEKCQIESLFVELQFDEQYILGSIYRHPNGNVEHFSDCLRQTLCKVKQHIPVLICGDINIDLIKMRHIKVKEYIDTLMELQLLPLISIPTRITDDTQTLIDHIYIRTSKKMVSKFIKTGVLYSDITDHLPTFIILSKTNLCKNQRRLVRIYNERSINNFKSELAETDWSVVTESTDVNSAYSHFITHFFEIFYGHFPLVKQSRARQRDKQWITIGLRESIRHKNILLKAKIKNPTDTNIEKYKSYNKILHMCLNAAENQYYLDILSCKNSSNYKFWKQFGTVLNPSKNKKQEVVTKLLCNNREITDHKLIANAFNDYFSTVGDKLSSKFPKESSFSKYMQFSSLHSVFLVPVVDGEIIKEITKLKPNKSSGPDNIPPKIIKYAAEHIAPVLTHIFNLSMQQGIYPDMLKISKVIALYKKGSKYLPENYRPISLLNIFDKILERLIYKRLVSFLNKHNMFYKFQFGFREGHSTILALTEIVDNVKISIDKNEYTIGIFLDLCKAFDTVDHSILLKKLKNYGIRGVAHSLISSYLSNRTQFTVINSVESEHRNIGFGVPQGSVLGPLLFIIFINDIQFCIPEENSRLFADDTGIFVSGREITATVKTAQTLLYKLHEWFQCNKLTISVPKCAWMVFHGRNKKLPENIPDLYIDGMAITRVNSYKYIGLILDSHLSWVPHVNSICEKLNKYFGIFCYIRNKIPRCLLRQVYFSTVFPHVNYGLELFGTCAKKTLHKLQVKQNQLLKVLSHTDRLYPTDDLHSNFNIMKISDLYQVKVLSFVQSCLNKTTIPLFHEYYTLHHATHEYDTRHDLIITQPRTRTAIGHSATKVHGASLWNNNEIAKQNISLSKATFKKKLTVSFINRYT